MYANIITYQELGKNIHIFGVKFVCKRLLVMDNVN